MLVISRIFILAVLLLANFLLLDFPGAKIVIYLGIVTVVVSYFYKRSAAGNFDVDRVTDNYRLFAGIPEPNILRASSRSFFPIHAITITDTVDTNIALENKHSFLASLSPKAEKHYVYPISGRKRGKYQVGPTYVSFTDIMGIYSFEYEVDTNREVIVFPNIHQINNLTHKSMQPLGVIRNKLPIFEDQTIITGLRNYQSGDEIKRINWKVSAKHNKFMVNIYQPSISSSSAVMLNLYEGDFDFKNWEYYMEGGIEIAVAILRQLFVLKQDNLFSTNCRINGEERDYLTDIDKGESHFTEILSNLAVVESGRKTPLKDSLNPQRLKLHWGYCLYVITTKLDEESLRYLIEYKRTGHSITLINFGPEIRRDMSLWNIGFQCYFAEKQDNIITLLRI